MTEWYKKTFLQICRQKSGVRISDLPYYKRTVWFEMKRLCLSDYPKKQLEDFSRYVFGVPYAVIQEALTREDVMKHGRNACAD